MSQSQEEIDGNTLKLSKYKDKMISLRSTINNLKSEFDDGTKVNLFINYLPYTNMPSNTQIYLLTLS